MNKLQISLSHQAYALLTVLLLDRFDHHAGKDPTGDLWQEIISAAKTGITHEQLNFWATVTQDIARAAALTGINSRDECALIFLVLYAFCQPSEDRLAAASVPLALARAWKEGKDWAEEEEEAKALDDLWVTAAWVANY